MLAVLEGFIMHAFPNLGFGLGLRPQHYQTILDTKPQIDWFEVITENFLVAGGKPLFYLEQVRQDYPIVMHGVSMSIGSADPLNLDYLNKLKDAIRRFEPKWISDHLCWTGIHSKNMHDLLPMPYTERALEHVIERVQMVQDYLGHPILLENPSSYVEFKESRIPEWEFLKALTERSGCYLLLDVNNVYVSSYNHGYDPIEYIAALPKDSIKQIHLAGHTHKGDLIIDTHDHPIIEPVFELYAEATKMIGPVATMIERDDNIPPLDELLCELEQVRKIQTQVLSEMQACA